MESIDEVKARHAEELAEAVKKEEVAANLPVRPDKVHLLGASNVYVSWVADTLQDALSLVREIGTLPYVQTGGTFTEFHHTGSVPERAAVMGSFPEGTPRLNLSILAQDEKGKRFYQEEASLHFMCSAGGEVVNAVVRIKQHPFKCEIHGTTKANRLFSWAVQKQADSAIRWYTHDRSVSNRVSLLWYTNASFYEAMESFMGSGYDITVQI